MNEIYSTCYQIPQNTLLTGHLILRNFQSTEDIVQRSVRLLYCRFGQGYQNLDEILVLREEIEIFSRDINNPESRNSFFFLEDQKFHKKFSGRRKNYTISRTNKNCERFTGSVQKKFKIIPRNEKKIDRRERKKSVLSDLHTARQGWGGKPTFVSELQQCVNIFSQFTIFCEKKQQKSKEFHKK